MPSKKNPEIDALEAVYGALKELTPDTRMKVLKGVYALLGIEGAYPEHDQERQSRPEYNQTPSSEVDESPSSQVTETPSVSLGGRQKSLMELVLDKEPSTNIERIALFAYYREKYEGKSRFGRSDLESYFAKAKVIPPKNYNRDFTEAVKKGWIHEDGSDSYITTRGIEAVESGFAAEKPSRATKPKSRSNGKKGAVSSKKQAKKGHSSK